MESADGSGHAAAFTARATTSHDARAFVTASLTSRVATSTLNPVRLIASELVSNALQHGGAGEVELTLHLAEDAVELSVVGGQTTPAQLPDPSLWSVAPATATAGRGLGIVAALAEHITLGTRDGMLVVHCRVRR